MCLLCVMASAGDRFSVFTDLLEFLDDSDDSDDEVDLLCCLATHPIKQRRVIRPRVLNYAEGTVQRYSEVEFKQHFRVNKDTFGIILKQLEPAIISSFGRPSVDPEKQLLILLWTVATPDSYRSVCDRFNIGRATAVRTVRRVTKTLFEMAPRFIQWPKGERVEEVWKGFESTGGFPRVIGAIDGTHIPITAPHKDPDSYINRKGYHSIQLQAVCDHRGLFTNCYAGHVGSVHDMRVFRNSEVQSFMNDETKFPGNSHLIGDPAYTLMQHLMVPFRNNGHLTDRQKNFNFCLSSSRMVIERAFGLLKVRFRSLLHCLTMTRIDMIPEYIIACCVLHNICQQNNDELSVAVIAPEPPEPPEQHIERNIDRTVGTQKRNSIAGRLIIRDN